MGATTEVRARLMKAEWCGHRYEILTPLGREAGTVEISRTDSADAVTIPRADWNQIRRYFDGDAGHAADHIWHGKDPK